MSPQLRSRLAVGVGAVAAAFLLGLLTAPRDADADALTRVFLNGRPVPVYFNDGDSFRILGGRFQGTMCRLAGFNTLESYGPVHQWGGWHPYELFILAKQGTRNGQRGVWHCTTDGNRDTYGRLLVDCPDLAVDQIRKGLAHAMNIDDTPSRPEYLRAQREAIRARRGIWAHGVPDFIMTSTHSADEDLGRPWHYNRQISTRDGHSESMRHRDTYAECEWVCATETTVDEAGVDAAARQLRADPALAPRLAGWSNLLLQELVSRYPRTRSFPEWVTGDRGGGPLSIALETRLSPLVDDGTLRTEERPSSCNLYVAFDRRYGRDQAACLRGRGTWTPADTLPTAGDQ